MNDTLLGKGRRKERIGRGDATMSCLGWGSCLELSRGSCLELFGIRKLPRAVWDGGSCLELFGIGKLPRAVWDGEAT